MIIIITGIVSFGDKMQKQQTRRKKNDKTFQNNKTKKIIK